MAKMKLENKVVLITGGSRGIGKTIAEKFSENGAQIVITSKSKNRLKNTEKGIENCFSVAGDVRSDKDVKNISSVRGELKLNKSLVDSLDIDLSLLLRALFFFSLGLQRKAVYD